ncbi:hypothetical protein C0J50_5970 [Silurus asotus]|uniref:Uncharacterized protein n=1 Tax=Silurus asotus TaxID=30991 RepID=A0AAD5FAH6_SILAS|nr:hypothetical protein C0J50_5970 [Silurus asotus]
MNPAEGVALSLSSTKGIVKLPINIEGVAWPPIPAEKVVWRQDLAEGVVQPRDSVEGVAQPLFYIMGVAPFLVSVRGVFQPVSPVKSATLPPVVTKVVVPVRAQFQASTVGVAPPLDTTKGISQPLLSALGVTQPPDSAAEGFAQPLVVSAVKSRFRVSLEDTSLLQTSAVDIAQFRASVADFVQSPVSARGITRLQASVVGDTPLQTSALGVFLLPVSAEGIAPLQVSMVVISPPPVSAEGVVSLRISVVDVSLTPFFAEGFTPFLASELSCAPFRVPTEVIVPFQLSTGVVPPPQVLPGFSWFRGRSSQVPFDPGRMPRPTGLSVGWGRPVLPLWMVVSGIYLPRPLQRLSNLSIPRSTLLLLPCVPRPHGAPRCHAYHTHLALIYFAHHQPLHKPHILLQSVSVIVGSLWYVCSCMLCTFSSRTPRSLHSCVYPPKRTQDCQRFSVAALTPRFLCNALWIVFMDCLSPVQDFVGRAPRAPQRAYP